MSVAQTVSLLSWACYAGALLAIVVYVVHFLGRQGWRRPWNAAGLFFTSIALSQIPFVFRNIDASGKGLNSAIVVAVCLLAAAGLQSLTALRRRRRRDDVTPAAGTAA